MSQTKICSIDDFSSHDIIFEFPSVQKGIKTPPISYLKNSQRINDFKWFTLAKVNIYYVDCL